MAPQLEGEGPAGLGAAGEQVQVEAVVGHPVHGERDEVDGPQKQAGSCKDQQEDRPGKGEEKGGQGRRQGGKQIGQAAPKIIKPEGDLVPVWGLQQALAASAGEVEAAQDQAAILAEQGEIFEIAKNPLGLKEGFSNERTKAEFERMENELRVWLKRNC